MLLLSTYREAMVVQRGEDVVEPSKSTRLRVRHGALRRVHLHGDVAAIWRHGRLTYRVDTHMRLLRQQV